MPVLAMNFATASRPAREPNSVGSLMLVENSLSIPLCPAVAGQELILDSECSSYAFYQKCMVLRVACSLAHVIVQLNIGIGITPAPLLAKWSAVLLPLTPLCPGVHVMCIDCSGCPLTNALAAVTNTLDAYWHGCLERLAMAFTADRLSQYIQILQYPWFLAICFAFMNAHVKA
ncbi:hypothetical protein AG1IA_08132 [Rhizoctonia solani AG-1 IA]|uniref:Uncharacterized protein n=1 Tax=Thanatephorus cucumeris (strain AG1-IA) TaxID=983506 RepID=L8WM01_THACA|nr:hypothetical protein AG1IA_08132 [Rhizoctonia solani AG-1 IA]